MKKYINSVDVVVDDATGAIVVASGVDGKGKPDILSWPDGSDNWAVSATGAVLHDSSVVFIRVGIGGAFVSIDDADGAEKPYVIPPNYWREIVIPGGIPAGARIVAKNFTAGSNFSDLTVEVR